MQLAIISAPRVEDGVFIMGTMFGRGIDFKLARDGYVVVIMNGDCKLNHADVN